MKHPNTETAVRSNRIIYTPSDFAKTALLHLQEVGELQALQVHTNERKELVSYLFFVVTKGSGQLHYSSKAYSLHTGDCVFIDCRCPYSHTASKEDLWALKWIHFYGPNMNLIYDKYVSRGGKPVFTPQNTDSFCQLLEELHTCAGSENHLRDMILNEKITSLLTLIMSESWHPENRSQTGNRQKTMTQIRDYLEEHYAESISLEQLSEHFFINKFYLTRLFKEQYGMTIGAYLDQVRITHAKELLRFSNQNVEEIGKLVGIEEPGYFNRVFKKVEGINPGKYRKTW